MDNLGVAMNATSIESYALSKGIKKSYQQMSKAEQIGLAMEMFLEQSAYATGNYAKENETFSGSFTTLKASFQNFMSGVGDISSVIDNVVAFGEILVQKITEMAPKIIEGIVQLLGALMPQLPVLIETLLPTIVDGIVMVISGLMSALPVLVQTLLPSLITGFIDLISAFIAMLPSFLPVLLQALIDGALMLVIALAEQLPEMLPQIIEALLKIIPLIIDNLPLFINAGIQLITGLARGLIKAIPKLLEAVPKIIASIFNFFKEMPEKALGIGKDLIYGLWDGIKNVTDWLYKKIKGFVNKALDKIKGFFGIKSPSKEFAIIGRYNIEGLEEGIMDEEKSLNKTLEATLGSGMKLANDMAINGNIASNFDKQQAIVLNANIEAKVNEGVLFDASSRINYNKSLQTGFGG